MYKILLFFTLFTCSVACYSKMTVIHGKVRGYNNTTVSLFLGSSVSGIVIDSALIKNDTFSLKAELKELTFCTIVFNKTLEGLKIIPNTGLRVVQLSNGKLSVVGSRESEIFNYLLSSTRETGIRLIESELFIKKSEENGQSETELQKAKKIRDSIQSALLKKEMLVFKDKPIGFTALYVLNRNYTSITIKEFKRHLGEIPKYLHEHSLYIKLKNLYGALSKSSRWNKAPSFLNKDFITGEMVSLNNRSRKYILLDFWGTWCAPCIAGIPELVELSEKYGKRISVISIAYENKVDTAALHNFIINKRMAWHNIVIKNGDLINNIVNLYGVNTFPTYVLINPEGKIVYRFDSALELSRCIEIIKKEIAE